MLVTSILMWGELGRRNQQFAKSITLFDRQLSSRRWGGARILTGFRWWTKFSSENIEIES